MWRRVGPDADTVAERIADSPPTLGSALGIPLKAYAERHGKVRPGDKRPAYALHVEEILRLFPDAHLVHLVRDVRDRVASLLGMPWWHRGFHEAVVTWAQVMDVTRRYARGLGPDSWHELRFEDLVADPEARLRALCAYLGETYAPETTEPHRMAGTAVPARKTWHHGALDVSRAGRWQQRLTPDQIRLCDAVLGGVPLRGVADQGAGIRRSGALVPPGSVFNSPQQGASWPAVSGEIGRGVLPERSALDPLHHDAGHDPVLGQRLARQGYELTGAVRPDPAEVLRYRKVSALRAAHAKRRMADRVARVREPGPVAAVAR